MSKDRWERASIVATIATGFGTLFLSIAVAYVANLYREDDKKEHERQVRADAEARAAELRTQELSALTSLLPELDDTKRRRAALVALNEYASPQIAATMADIYRGEQSIDALKHLASTNNHERRKSALNVLNKIANEQNSDDQKRAKDALLDLAPSLNLEAKSEIAEGRNQVRLKWAGRLLSNCSASGSWAGKKDVTGEEIVGPFVDSQSFTMTCNSFDSEITRVAVVAIPQPIAGIVSSSLRAPTVTLSASPSSLSVGQSAVLTWSSEGAKSCKASGGWSGEKQPNGSEITAPLSGSTTYTITCSGPAGEYANRINVGPPLAEESGGGSLDASFAITLFFFLMLATRSSVAAIAVRILSCTLAKKTCHLKVSCFAV